jgi:hypothetical protein
MRQLQPSSTITYNHLQGVLTYTHLQGVLTHKGHSHYIFFQTSVAVKMSSALFLGFYAA